MQDLVPQALERDLRLEVGVHERRPGQRRARHRGPVRRARVDDLARLAQSLHLPLDLKVLLGVELARSENSRILLDALDADGSTRRYIGGLAVNF